MNAMNWIKGAVVAMGLSLGGSALAAGPSPLYVDYQSQGTYQNRGGHDRDFNESWLNDGNNDRHDWRDLRMLRLGRDKVREGRAMQARGQALIERSRYNGQYYLARRGERMIDRGQQLEREGRTLIYRARS